MSLSHLKVPSGAKKTRKRVGRGQGSGLGKTAGRGAKGQKARSGNMRFEGFEGGQSPLQRRMPKFVFTNTLRREFEEVQVLDLNELKSGVVDGASLKDAGLVRGNRDGIVVLGTGELKVAHTIRVDRITKGARAAVEKAGGKIDLLPPPMTKTQKAKAQTAKPASK